jgi:hypothetical protein
MEGGLHASLTNSSMTSTVSFLGTCFPSRRCCCAILYIKCCRLTNTCRSQPRTHLLHQRAASQRQRVAASVRTTGRWKQLVRRGISKRAQRPPCLFEACGAESGFYKCWQWKVHSCVCGGGWRHENCFRARKGVVGVSRATTEHQ